MSLEQLPESDAPRPPLAPRRGSTSPAQPIFWNEQELRAGWRLLIFLFLATVIATVELLLLTLLHVPQAIRGQFTAPAFLISETSQLLALLAAASIMSVLEARPFGAYGLPPKGAFSAKFWQGAAWGIVMVSTTVFLIRACDGFSFGDLALRGPALWGYAVLWGAVFVVVGLFEEFLFRGYAQFTLATSIGFWPAAGALSATFGAVHLMNPGEGKIGAMSVFAVGMFFCLTLRRTGNLWFAVGLHFTFDWGETFLFSVPNSGIVAPGHLLNSSFHGPTWLTGGTVGPEGSVMAFAVVGVAAAIFSRAYPAK